MSVVAGLPGDSAVAAGNYVTKSRGCLQKLGIVEVQIEEKFLEMVETFGVGGVGHVGLGSLRFCEGRGSVTAMCLKQKDFEMLH